MTAITTLANNLADGKLKSRDLVETALNAIAAPDGEGERTFLRVNAEQARAEADGWDSKRRDGEPVPRFAGIPMALKDLFDVAGEVTTAGSIVLKDAAPATMDAPCIANLRNAGFIFIGRTNMVEFAFGGVGTNAHYGTPLSIYDRNTGRVPGGSSSGSAVAVADNMAAVAMGTDTGGSCRIPAAFNNLVGYKPTANRISTDGVYPLAHSLDSVGPIGKTVACCAAVDGILAEDWIGAPKTVDARSLNIGVLQNYVLERMDDHVAAAIAAATTALSSAGITLTDMTLAAIEDIPSLYANGGPAGAEALSTHRARLASDGDKYDPNVGTRIALAEAQSAADYIDVMRARKQMIIDTHAITRDFDAILMPTTAIIPPTLAEVTEKDDYFARNGLILRNTTVGNFLDRCAISIPVTQPDGPPVGLMLMGENGADAKLFAIAAAFEAILGSHRS